SARPRGPATRTHVVARVAQQGETLPEPDPAECSGAEGTRGQGHRRDCPSGAEDPRRKPPARGEESRSPYNGRRGSSCRRWELAGMASERTSPRARGSHVRTPRRVSPSGFANLPSHATSSWPFGGP